jgi:hypothetical protein
LESTKLCGENNLCWLSAMNSWFKWICKYKLREKMAKILSDIEAVFWSAVLSWCFPYLSGVHSTHSHCGTGRREGSHEDNKTRPARFGVRGWQFWTWRSSIFGRSFWFRCWGSLIRRQ